MNFFYFFVPLTRANIPMLTVNWRTRVDIIVPATRIDFEQLVFATRSGCRRPESYRVVSRVRNERSGDAAS